MKDLWYKFDINPPLFETIDDEVDGNNTIVAATAGKKIRVLAAVLVSAGTTTVQFQSGAGGTALTGAMTLAVNSGFTLPFNPVGWFETAAGSLLNLANTENISVDGCIVYQLV